MSYSSKDLKGLSIGHKAESFQEGQSVILTLKDQDVLDDGEDVLQNVNMVDDERTEKSNKNKKKPSAYKPWDDEEFDDFDPSTAKNLLSKYDEEIDGVKQNTFRIGDNVKRTKTLKDFHEAAAKSGTMFSTLSEFKVASEYYTPDEMVSFKKSKKKGNIRKKEKKAKVVEPEVVPHTKTSPTKRRRLEEGELESSRDHGRRSRRHLEEGEIESSRDHGGRDHRSRRHREEPKSKVAKLDLSRFQHDDDEDEDEFGPDEDLSNVRIEEDQAEKELALALQKARKLKQKEMKTVEENVARIAETVKSIKKDEEEESSEVVENRFMDDEALPGTSNPLILNKTSEFCRNLGTANGNDYDDDDDFDVEPKREIDSDDSDMDIEMKPSRVKDDSDHEDHRMSDDDDDEEKYDKNRKLKNQPILEEEPQLTSGIAGALQLAMRKGYLDRENKKVSGASKSSGLLSCEAYQIEEKFNDNDNSRRRDRYAGEVTAFQEKEGYKPDFKLDYVDDKGMEMNSKEAFRFLSHKFHGKTSGKNKTDKRLKKLEQESKIRQMASTDTPLNTLKMFQERQKAAKSAFVVLTGKDAEANKVLKAHKK